MKCLICGQAVSMKDDRASSRVQRDDGGWDHALCTSWPPSSIALRREWFGDAREIVRSEEQAAAYGHTVRREKRSQVPQQRARCSCGWVTAWTFSSDLTRLKKQHLHDAAVRAGLKFTGE